VVERLVIDTGPLIALSRAAALDVIGRLPVEFLCPREVRQELDEGAAAGHLQIVPTWLHVVSLARSPHPISRAALDLGEAAVIELALDRKIEWVGIDDWKGRRAALSSGLRVTGTLGLLGRAKREGLISAVRPVVDVLSRSGIWYEPELIKRFLEAIGET